MIPSTRYKAEEALFIGKRNFSLNFFSHYMWGDSLHFLTRHFILCYKRDIPDKLHSRQKQMKLYECLLERGTSLWFFFSHYMWGDNFCTSRLAILFYATSGIFQTNCIYSQRGCECLKRKISLKLHCLSYKFLSLLMVLACLLACLFLFWFVLFCYFRKSRLRRWKD